MTTHLLVWNPDRWSWKELPRLLQTFMQGRPVTMRWSCGRNRRVHMRDRVFLLRTPRFPVGIFASGRVIRGPREVDGLMAQDSGRTEGLFVEIRFDMLANPDTDMPLTRRELSRGALRRYRWEGGISGQTLPKSVAEALEFEWAEHFDAPSADEKADDKPATQNDKQKEVAASPEPVAVDTEAKKTPPTKPDSTASRKADEKREAGPTPANVLPKPPKSAAALAEEHMFGALFERYMIMLEAAVAGRALNRKQHVNELMDDYGVLSKGVVRQYFGEMGAVLRQCGLPFLDVYPPSGSPGRVLRRLLVQFLVRERDRLHDIWFGEEAVRKVRIHDELVDMQSAWAPPPFNENFRVDAFLAGRARFPSFGGYQRQEQQWSTLKEAGCQFALAFERTRLQQLRCHSLIKKIRLLEPDERKEGVDIVSFEADGSERFIHVATTQYSRRFPFLVEPNALRASYQYGKHYYLYRVFHFCWEAKLYMVQGDLRENVQFLNQPLE